MHVGEKKSILFRWEAVLAAFLLILSMAVTFLPGLKVEAAETAIIANEVIKEGSDFSLTIVLGEQCTENVTIRGKGGLSGTFIGKTYTSDRRTIDVPKKQLTFDGENQPQLVISYVNASGTSRTKEYTFPESDYKLSGESSSTIDPVITSDQLRIKKYELTPNYIAYGGKTTLKVTVENRGSSMLNGVAITLGGLATGSITVSGGSMDTEYRDIPASSEVTATFTIVADEGITTGTQILSVTASFGEITAKQNIYVNTYGKEDKPTDEPSSAPELIGNQITVSKNAFMPEIKAGETKNIQIPLNATSVVGSAQVTLTMPEGLYLESAAATQTVNFKKGSASISCRVTAKEDVTDSVASIDVSSVYSYDNKQVSEKTTFSVRLRASDDIKSNGKLVITGYQLGSSTLSYNGDTSLTITVQNTGSATMKDITMTLDGMATGSVTLKSGMDVQTLVELGPGQQSTFTYQLHGDKALPSGTAILTATAACGEEKSVAKVFVPCVGKPETSGGEGESGPGSSKPQVIIESYTYGEEGTSVTGGSTFTLSMTLKNTSSSSAIENIKMVVSSAADETTGGVFTPASSSNSFFIAKVGAGESFTESIDLTVKADAPPKSYGIDVQIAYEAVIDGKRESLTATERITIPVSQPDRFEVEDAQISSTVYVGDSTYCSVSYVNKGKSAIYNLSIAVEGTGFTTADANTYVGNVEAGNGDYFETTLNVTEPGTIDGKFIITYEDSAGTQTTLERPFTATVMEMDWGEPDPMEPTEPVDANPGLPLWGKILIIVGCVVVAGGIVVVVLRIRRKKRKAVPVFDDEDDDDYGDDDFDE